MSPDRQPLTPRTSFTVGEESSFTHLLSDDVVRRFAEVSRDFNPVHLDDAYAASTSFGGRIVHGALLTSLISSVLGNQLPGPGSIYRSQEAKFRLPVFVGETVTVHVRIESWDDTRGRLELSTRVLNERGEEAVLGTARLVMASFVTR